MSLFDTLYCSELHYISMCYIVLDDVVLYYTYNIYILVGARLYYSLYNNTLFSSICYFPPYSFSLSAANAIFFFSSFFFISPHDNGKKKNRGISVCLKRKRNMKNEWLDLGRRGKGERRKKKLSQKKKN